MIEFGKPKKLLCETKADYRLRPRGRKPVMFTYKGETRSVIEWAGIHNLGVCALKKRIKLNWSEDRLFSSRQKHRTPEQIAQDEHNVKVAKLRKQQEIIDHHHAVNMAILKVLDMRKRRLRLIEINLDHIESIHCAIDAVLEMRASRAKRMRNIRLDVAA